MFEQLNQNRIHEFVFVRDTEHRNSLAFQGVPELSVQSVPVGLLHYNDYISPFYLLIGERDFGIVIQAGGIRLDARVVRKDGFSGRASKLVLRADKQEVLHSTFEPKVLGQGTLTGGRGLETVLWLTLPWKCPLAAGEGAIHLRFVRLGPSPMLSY